MGTRLNYATRSTEQTGKSMTPTAGGTVTIVSDSPNDKEESGGAVPKSGATTATNAAR